MSSFNTSLFDEKERKDFIEIGRQMSLTFSMMDREIEGACVCNQTWAWFEQPNKRERDREKHLQKCQQQDRETIKLFNTVPY